MTPTRSVRALRAMAISPSVYLYAPRFIALVLMVPLLVIFADFIGFMAGLFVYVYLYQGNPYAYFVFAGYMLTAVDI